MRQPISLLLTAAPQGLDKSFNARTFLRYLGSLHFVESLWLSCSTSPLCILQFHPFKKGFGHQVTSNTHQPVSVQLLSHVFPDQLMQGDACPEKGCSTQNKPTRQHTLLVIFRFFPTNHPPAFSGKAAPDRTASSRTVSLTEGRFPCSAAT